jgi:N-acetylmuramoyl-L-alanine amidase
MPVSFTIRLGDCLASLAFERGIVDYRKLVDDPANAEVMAKRPNPDVLVEGDVLVVPDRVPKVIQVASGAHHKLRVSQLVVLLKVVVHDDSGAALAGKKYHLTVGTALFEGATGSDGSIEHAIPPAARSGTLDLWLTNEPGIEAYRFPLELGALEHESIDRACWSRLENLGFVVDHRVGAADAVRGFQLREGLDVTGELDDGTRAALRRAHEGE